MADASVASELGIIEQLPLLTVVVPMLAAPLCIVFGNRHIAWVLAFASSLFAFLGSVHLMAQVMDGDVISYHLGG
ncbi:MAG: hypothetical protein AAFW66_11955, partial [Pseudomonadota bacterium]